MANYSAPNPAIGNILQNLKPDQKAMLMMSMMGGGSQALAQLGPNATAGQAIAAMGGGLASGQLGGMQQMQQAAQQERAFSLQEQTLQARQQEAQRKAAEQAEQDAIVAGMPPEQQRLFKLFGAQSRDLIHPKPEKPERPQIFGSEATGYYQLGPDGRPQQLIGGLGRATPQEPLHQVFDPETGQVTYAPRSAAAGQMAPPTKGMRISTGPDGQTIVETGVTPGSAAGLAKPTVNQLEEQMVADTSAMQRLDAIAQGYRPEYSQIGTRAGMRWADLRDRVGALGEDERQALSDFSIWRQDSISNVNRTIKELTGAAMTQGEAERITSELPNPGTGVFDGDSPTVFKSKLDNAVKRVKLSYARKAYIRNQGLPQTPDFGGIPLEDMGRIINQRGAELESQLASQGLPPDQVMQRVAAQLRQEFGI